MIFNKSNLYLIDFNQERPLKIFRIPKGTQCRFLEYKDHYDLLLLGFVDGTFEVTKKKIQRLKFTFYLGEG